MIEVKVESIRKPDQGTLRTCREEKADAGTEDLWLGSMLHLSRESCPHSPKGPRLAQSSDRWTRVGEASRVPI